MLRRENPGEKAPTSCGVLQGSSHKVIMQMMNWHTASLVDFDFIQQCAFSNNLMANNYSAVNSILYAKKYDSQIAIDGDWLFEKYREDGKIFFSFPHNVTGDKTDVASALKKLAAEEAKSGHSFAIRNITEDEKELVSQIFNGAEIKEEPGLSDYIYLAEKLASLSGKKLSRKRNHIHQFSRKYADFRYEPLCEANIEAVRIVERKWLAENGADSVASVAAGADVTCMASENGAVGAVDETGSASGVTDSAAGVNSAASGTNVAIDSLDKDLLIEQEIINYALDNFVFFARNAGMSGGVLFVGDEPVAFCIASTLSPFVMDVHFEKCIAPFATDGGYAVINNEFAKTIRTQYINREEDLGLEGLRKAKLSYYPEIVLGKFTARIL